MQRFKIYKASAGSGKTFSLVLEYIKILVSNPNEYRHILAVTFTNDATEEMKGRVLKELKVLADDPVNSKYMAALVQHFGEDSEFHISKRAAEALKNILHDYSNFHITTIDAFFQKILRSFARDIGLSAAYNLELDSESALYSITEKVISDTNPENRQSKWLMNAALEKIESGKSWNIREELKSLFKETFRENYQVKEEKIRVGYADEASIDNLQKKTRKEISAFEQELVTLAGECIQLLKNYGLTRESFKGKGRSFFGWVIKMYEKKFEDPNPTFLKALNNVDEWYTKTEDPALVEKIIDIYHAGLNAAMNELAETYAKGIEAYNSNKLIAANLPYFAMFELMVEELMRYKSENDVLFISDTGQFIKEIIGDNEESFIFEKSGNEFHHYLIDEFQDTSQLQWNNFSRLINNSISQGYTSLVVGDVKQSIYRFRNGDWQLLHHQVKEEITYSEDIYLEYNFRSLENITRFNNTLYDIAPGITELAFNRDIEAVNENEWGEKFAACYEKQVQKVPPHHKNGQGYIKIKTFLKEEGAEENGEEETGDHSAKAQKLKQLLEDILSALERGYKPSEMIVLVFTKREAATVAAFLQQYVEKNKLSDQLNIVTQSALNISNAHTVQLVLAVIRYLVNKKDEVNFTNIDHIYRKYILNEPSVDFSAPVHKKIESIREEARILQSMPLQLLVEKIIAHFTLDSISEEQIFLQHLKDSVYDYLGRQADDMTGFMEWWEENAFKYNAELPESEQSLQIITIHKSKGMEYDVVFIPFADWEFDSTGLKADMLWLDVPGEDIPVLPVKYDKKMMHSVFEKEYLKNKFNNYLDRLNLLYVATTRASRELYIYADHVKNFKPEAPGSHIKSVFNMLMVKDFPFDDELHLDLAAYRNTEEREIIIGTLTQPGKKEKEAGAHPLVFEHTGNNVLDTLAIRQKALDYRNLKETLHEERRHSGVMFHEIAAKSNSPEEAGIQVKKLFLRKEIDRSQYEKFQQDFDLLFRQPEWQEWINNYHIYAEYSITMFGELLKPDKVFVNEQEVIIVDFKTGAPKRAYHEQVLAYMQALAAVFNRPVKGYLYYTSQQQFIQVQ